MAAVFWPSSRIRIHRIQQVNRIAADDVVQHPHATVEVGAELAGQRAIVERLRKFSPGNLAIGNHDQAAHPSACGVGRHRGRGISGGSAGDPVKLVLAGERDGHGHARVFERARGIHPLMLCPQAVNPSRTRTTRQIVNRSIAFAQRNRRRPVVEFGKHVAESPDSAGVQRLVRSPAFAPQGLQFRGIRRRPCRPVGELHFQQVAAIRATEIDCERSTHFAARYAANTVVLCGSGSCRFAEIPFSNPWFWILVFHSKLQQLNSAVSGARRAPNRRNPVLRISTLGTATKEIGRSWNSSLSAAVRRLAMLRRYST